MLSKMLVHLERQPFNIERRKAWLSLIEPVFDAMVCLYWPISDPFSLYSSNGCMADDVETVNLVKK
jgi:hypothetical protein